VVASVAFTAAALFVAGDVRSLSTLSPFVLTGAEIVLVGLGGTVGQAWRHFPDQNPARRGRKAPTGELPRLRDGLIASPRHEAYRLASDRPGTTLAYEASIRQFEKRRMSSTQLRRAEQSSIPRISMSLRTPSSSIDILASPVHSQMTGIGAAIRLK
jgi:hypothetical protein